MAKEPKEQGSQAAPQEEKPICGIVMPISPMADFPLTHWADVQRILEDAITLAGFFPRVVSMSNVPTIIHKDIVHNLYSDPIVVCDVSGGNPNVMLEVGMRLAFHKPTIIVKDDVTKFNFDTQPLRQLEYPRDLRHGRIEEFKGKLKEMIAATVDAEKAPGYTSFLKSFGPFKVAKLEETEVAGSELLFDRLSQAVRRLELLEKSNSYDAAYGQLRNFHSKPPEGTGSILHPEAAVPIDAFVLQTPVVSDSVASEIAIMLGATTWRRVEHGPLFQLAIPTSMKSILLQLNRRGIHGVSLYAAPPHMIV